METYQCQANITDADNKINFTKGNMITQETYDKLPERFKLKFQKISANPQLLSGADVRKLLLELRERVGNIEAKLSNKK